MQNSSLLVSINEILNFIKFRHLLEIHDELDEMQHSMLWGIAGGDILLSYVNVLAKQPNLFDNQYTLFSFEHLLVTYDR